MEKKAVFFFILALALAGLVASFFAGYRTAAKRPPVEIRDTVEVVRIDTIQVDRPVAVYRRTVDTLLLSVHDTTRVRDTLFMEVPVEQVRYRDSLYQAWVSGYRPSLDSIRIYAPVRVVTITEAVEIPKIGSWGFGVSAGFGASIPKGGAVQLAPYIGLGVTYNLVTW